MLAGTREPRVCHRPSWASEASAEECIDLATSIGLELFPWQQDAVRMILAENDHGRWAAREAALLVARQNGKNVILEAIAIHGLFVGGDSLTLWSAHQFKTTQEAFVRVRAWIDGSRDLRSHVDRITFSAGNEGVIMKNGARLRFVARSKSSGRGFSPQRIIFDEAQELPLLAVEAMLPSLSAQANPQSIFTGTVPNEGNDSEYWTGIRDRGRVGQDRHLAWMEFSPEGSDDPATARVIDLDDHEVHAQANPSAGLLLGLSADTITAERAAFARHPHAFARERCSIWPSGGPIASMISEPQWAALEVDQPEPDSILSFGVKFSVSGSRVALAGALRSKITGNVFVEVIHERSASDGVAWLTAWLAERWQDAAAIVIDGRSGAPALINSLRDAGVSERVIMHVGPNDAIAACAGFVNAVQDRTLRHGNQPGMTEAIKITGRREIGTQGGWGFAPITADGDVTVVDASALAHHGAMTSKRKPGRKARVRV